ncbi:hypothetical protein VTK26DRAFT_8960 [Humicola hyalothermophila]
MDEMILLQRSLDATVLRDSSTAQDKRRQGRGGSRDDTKPRRFPDEPLASPPSHVDDLIETRSTRSASTASRSTSRLSLTLPIVPANAYPVRSTSVSSTTPGFPPTPLDTPSLVSPTDPSDLITAIAAQERRVLELREELSRAETDLAKLKKRWATHEAYKKRAERRNLDPARGLGPAAELHDETAVRRSLELDRRKALLSQQNQQATPERSRRRVFTGSHTRTLSLLSPTKPDGGFPTHDDQADRSKDDLDTGHAPAVPALPTKRASWAPRLAPTAGVNQLAQDLKTGLWTFMEDLRQATVGDEPITGQGAYMRGLDGNMRSTITRSATVPISGGDQDTIRATGSGARPRATSAFEETPKSAGQTVRSQSQDAGREKEEEGKSETASSRQTRTLQRSKTEASKPTKRFSWTPLTMDSYDDNDDDWSNWDSPNVSSPRWSGTTVNGDIIPSIPEKRDENETSTLKKQSSNESAMLTAALPASPSSSSKKLGELLPPVLKGLTPSSIKQTAADFMKEWERSLSPPDIPMPATSGKEKGM